MFQKNITHYLASTLLFFTPLAAETDSKIPPLKRQLKESPYNLAQYVDLAEAFLAEGKIDEAERTYFKALSLNPDFIDIAFGKEINTWTEEEHWFFGNHFFFKPAWKGEDLRKKTILVYAKKGFGDSLQFSRFLKLLKQKAQKVMFIPQKPLVDLFRVSFAGEVEIVDPDKKLSELEYDTHASLLALPHLLDIHISDIQKSPYLQINERMISEAKKELNPNTFNIGIVWQGDPENIHNEDLSTSLSTFSSLFDLPNVTFYSLQKGAAEKELKNSPHIINLSPKIKTFADTAAFMKGLDLIVTIGTSTSHLAGALGCPTIALLPQNHDIKWAGENNDNLWYDSVQAMRQEELGNWNELMKRVKTEINNRIR